MALEKHEYRYYNDTITKFIDEEEWILLDACMFVWIFLNNLKAVHRIRVLKIEMY